MRAQPKVKSAFSISVVPIITTAEIAAVVIGNVANQSADGVIRFRGYISLSTGTGVTAVVAKIRRGNGLTGNIVGGAATVQVGASLPTEITLNVEDTPGEVGGVPYTLTVQQTGATGNGAILVASLEALT